MTQDELRNDPLVRDGLEGGRVGRSFIVTAFFEPDDPAFTEYWLGGFRSEHIGDALREKYPEMRFLITGPPISEEAAVAMMREFGGAA
jgi:hypothetical protein